MTEPNDSTSKRALDLLETGYSIANSVHVIRCLFFGRLRQNGSNCDVWPTSKAAIYSDIVVNGH